MHVSALEGDDPLKLSSFLGQIQSLKRRFSPGCIEIQRPEHLAEGEALMEDAMQWGSL